jgi:hypothetical protein
MTGVYHGSCGGGTVYLYGILRLVLVALVVAVYSTRSIA